MTTVAPAAAKNTPQSLQQTLRRWEPWALTIICLIAATLYLWGIGSSWGNTYYSAAVKSMSRSFETFFFGSLDAAGVVTVDKPPMALWAQVISVKVFGYNQFAVMFPQVVAGVAAVLVLHRTVRRWAGEHAALIAALVLALTPITVMINRDTNPDTLLVLLVVAAAYAMTRAFDGPRSAAWLALAAFLVGCGFLTKMLQAWMVLPAFLAAYLIGSRASWKRKVADLSIAAGVLVVSSFWWVAATGLWPDPKPYVGGSTDGSAWDLVFGYNGFGRIFGGSNNPGSGGFPGGSGTGGGLPGGGLPGGGLPGGAPGGGGPGAGFGGQPGALRMFGDQLAGQISWLLPLCGLVMIAMLVAGVRRWRAGRPLDRKLTAGWVLWSGWLLVVGGTLSYAEGIMHPYYTTMMAPAVGALTGAGLMQLWRWYRRPSGRSWLLLPVAIATTVAWAFVVVARNLDWHGWAGYLALGIGVLAVAALLFRQRETIGRTGLAVGLAAVLTVPTAWSVIGAVDSEGVVGGTNPMAGPGESMFGRGSGGQPPGGFGGLPTTGNVQPGQPTQPGQPSQSGQPGQPGQLGPGGPGGAGGPGAGGDGTLTDDQSKLLQYVQANAGSLKIPLAVEGGSMGAASYIINSELTIVGMGGFGGMDNAPSVSRLEEWKQAGQLGFVQLGGGMGGFQPPAGVELPSGLSGAMNRMNGTASQRGEWVKQNCKLVDSARSGLSAQITEQLYDCR